MLTPSTGTLADYNAAILAGNATHVRVVFPVQNITFTDDDISADGGVTITTIMNPDEDLTFGKAISKEVVIHFLNSSTFAGFNWAEEFHIDFGVEISGTTNWVTVGYFTGQKPKRLLNVEVIEFIAHDRMQLFDVLADDFMSAITYPVTLATLYSNLCTFVGLSAAVSDDRISYASSASYDDIPLSNGQSCRQLLAWMAEAMGCYAMIDASGDVVLKWFTDQTSNYSIDADDYFAINIDEATTSTIDNIRFGSSNEEISGYIYPISPVGVVYTALDNPFLLCMTTSVKEDVATAMLSRFTALGNYTPMNLNTIGNWMVEAGDIIEVGYDENQTIDMPIFTKTFVWNGGGEDVYECTGKTERTEMTQSVQEQYKIGGLLSDKYTIISGIDITDDGIEITGAKSVKINSGGKFEVKSNADFIVRSGGVVDIDSDNLYIYSTGTVGIRRTVKTLHDVDSAEATFAIGSSGIGYDRFSGGIAISTNQTLQGSFHGGYATLTAHDTKSVQDKNYTASLNVGAFGTGLNGSGTLMPFITGRCGIGSVFSPYTDYDSEHGDWWMTNLIVDETITGDAVKNDLTVTDAGYVLDARQGKVLNDNFNTYIQSGTLPNNTDLNTVKTPGYYFVNSNSYTYSNLPIGTIFELIVSKPNTGNTILQIGVGVNCLYFRFATSDTTWSGWQSTQNCGEGWQATGTNIDNLLTAGRYGIDGTRTYTGTFPTGVSSGLLEVISPSSSTTWIWQRLLTAQNMFIRYRNQSNGTAWGNWYKFTGTLAQ